MFITDRKCTSLREGEPVVFLVYSDIYNRKIPMDGTVKFERVGRDRKKVSVYAAQ